MAFENKPVTYTEETSFEAVVDTAFEKVNEKHIQFSMRRLREMDEELAGIEKELNDFLNTAH